MFMRNPVAMLAVAVNTTVQAITNAAAALVEFDSGTGTPAAVEEGAMSNAVASSVVTVPDTGIYRCTLDVVITPPAVTHTITLSIQKATTNIVGASRDHVCVASTQFPMFIDCLVALVAGDTVRPAIVSSDAGPQNYTFDDGSFTVVRVA